MNTIVWLAALILFFPTPALSSETQENAPPTHTEMSKSLAITAVTQGNSLRVTIINKGAHPFPPHEGKTGALRIIDATGTIVAESLIGETEASTPIAAGEERQITLPLPPHSRTARLEITCEPNTGKKEGAAAAPPLYTKTWRLGWWWWSPVTD